MKALILLCFALLTVRTIQAHDEPTSYVDLRPAPDGMTVTVLASTTDLAHYLPDVEPDMLLKPAVLAAQQEALHKLINARLRCSSHNYLEASRCGCSSSTRSDPRRAVERRGSRMTMSSSAAGAL